jgi:2-aminoadipate transaminase
MDGYFPPGVDWTQPEGGLFTWVTLPENLDAAEVLKVAVEQKVAFVPGSPFFPGGGGHNTMRLNFSNANEDKIKEGMARLGSVLRKIVDNY